MWGSNAYAADACTPISSLPFVITSSGSYCVTSYLATSQTWGSAIEIQADDVILDLGNGGIDDLAAGVGTIATGIFAFDRNNITIQNGTIRGFAYGIALENSAPDFANTSGHVVDSILVELNRSVGVEVRGANTSVVRVLAASTGGAPFGSTVAISIFGPNPFLWQNNIVNTATQTPDAAATDILLLGSPNCQVIDNRMVNTVSGYNTSTGVMVWDSPDCVVSKNKIDNRTATTPLDVGVYIIDSERVQTISNKMTNVVTNYLH
jgi:hypothetical protein